jgi:hypothetical protein
VYRYLSGRLLDGTSSGGWGTPGTGSWWRRRPGWQRQTLRVWLPTAYLWGQAGAHPAVAEGTLLAVAVVGGPYAVRRGYRWWRLRRFHATYTRPTRAALALALGEAPMELRVDPGLGSLMTALARPMSPAEKRWREWYGQHLEPVVRWLPDRAQSGAWALQRWARPVTRHAAHFRRPVDDPGQRIEVRAAVPYLTPDQEQIIRSIIEKKLPAGELVSSFNHVGRHVTARWTVRKRPPSEVRYADLAARFDHLTEPEFFVGLGADARRVTISLDDDAPHIALSAGSGAGKSVLAALVGVQVLARGGSVVILDRKGSHRWARDLAGVDYCTRPEQMHNALLRLAAMADQRNSDAFHEDEGWNPGPRVLVIAEELNATMSQIRAWWEEERDTGEPRIPPAVRAFRELLFMGRSAKINVLAVAQMLTALTTGGPETRENFGVRCLARYTKNNWQMLVDGVGMPRPSRTLGRWQIVVQGTATETQVCYLKPAEAKLFVAKYRGVPVSPVTGGSPLMASDQELSPGHAPGGDITDPLSELVTLRAAVERGAVPWGFDAAKKRLQRARAAERAVVPAPAGRSGQADLYRVGDLIEWVESEMAT